MDKYDAANDPYCYSGTTMLENKFNITDTDELEQAEREITRITIHKIIYLPPHIA